MTLSLHKVVSLSIGSHDTDRYTYKCSLFHFISSNHTASGSKIRTRCKNFPGQLVVLSDLVIREHLEVLLEQTTQMK